VIWEQGYQMHRSRLRVDHCAQDVVELCIKYGIQFHLDDFKEMTIGGGYYCHGFSNEKFYAIACGCDKENYNMSACLAMENYWGRKPFLIREVRFGCVNKTPERVYVGRWFSWSEDGKTSILLKCTSFNDKKNYLNACQYKNDQGTEYNEKPMRQFKITHKDIREFHALLDLIKISKNMEKIEIEKDNEMKGEDYGSAR
jgi:hypothetical protein